MVEGKNREGKEKMNRTSSRIPMILPALMVVCAFLAGVTLRAQTAMDPGPRGGAPGAGGFQTGGCPDTYDCLSANEVYAEPSMTTQFETTFVVTGGGPTNNGLGPEFSSNSCSSCHAQPAPGGSSPATNPLFSVYQLNGAMNTMPSFETATGPVLVPRFPYMPSDLTVPDGLIQPLFVVTGRSDAGSCNIAQPNFTQAAEEGNLTYRQPLPTFGDGYIEIIEDASITANMNANLAAKQKVGIIGVPNIAGGDGSINRLGWKAQWRALLPAAGAEEQMELGVTNEQFPNELNETSGCNPNPLPEDSTQYSYTYDGVTYDGIQPSNAPWYFTGNHERDAVFMRFLAAPTPGACPNGGNCTNGQTQFNNVGCVLCHTTSYQTPPASIPSMGQYTINLFSDILLHHMGACLADNIVQGNALGDMWRTPPLWNVGQRYWFMHDARTSNIVTAVEDHSDIVNSCSNPNGYQASEADAVITNFNALSTQNQQDLIDFLRSL